MVGVHRGNKQGRDHEDPKRKTRSKMPPGGHLRPLGGGFLITVAAHKCGLHRIVCIFPWRWEVFASAHKCGLHPVCDHHRPDGRKLCLSAQMWIASHEARVHQRTGKLCLSAQMRIASRNHTGNQSKGALCLSAQMRIASAILHKNAISFFAACAVSR